jgi:HD-GYP domain-containing protein (c-di-GMP phosphodiesterase class II)/HAMP domain-containing protein
MRIEKNTFKSKISQRIFTSFVTCALFPVFCTAVMAYFTVSWHLEERTLDSLRHALKSHAKTLNDRLIGAAKELQLISSVTLDQNRIKTANLDIWLRDRLQSHFNSIVLFGRRDKPQPILNQYVLPPLNMTADDIKHIANGNPLLTELNISSSKPGLVLAQLVDAKNADLGFWAGEINQNYLWPTDLMDNLPLDTDYCVLDSSYRLLYSSRTDLVKISGLLKSNAQMSTSGHFELSFNDEMFIASYTQLFLEPTFKLPHWTIIFLKPKSDVFAPMAKFKISFPAIIILTLLVVMWLSIMTVRNNLVPISVLKKGAQRIAARDFSQPVKVYSHDEFQDLALVFNEMADALAHKFKTLSAKAKIDQVVATTFDPDEIIKAAVTRVADCVHCQVCGINLINYLGFQENQAFYSFQSDRNRILTERINLRSQECRVFNAHPKYLILDANSHKPHYIPLNPQLQFPNLLLLPVFVKKNLSAILWLARNQSERFTTEDLTLARQLADQVAVALANSNLIAELKEMNWGALQALARAVDAKSAWTAGHSERVAKLAFRMGKTLHLSSDALEDLQRAAFLHDIGKIGVPVAVLDKTSKLNDEEFGLIKCHPGLGAKIIEPINAFKSITPMIAQHHERFDGKGYPAGLAGEEIHQGARILAVADVYDAISSDRPYRKGMLIEEVLVLIQSEAGGQFDPVMVEALLKVIAEEQQQAA